MSHERRIKAKYMYWVDISSGGYAGSAAVLVRTERAAGKSISVAGMRNRRSGPRTYRRLADGEVRAAKQVECLIS